LLLFDEIVDLVDVFAMGELDNICLVGNQYDDCCTGRMFPEESEPAPDILKRVFPMDLKDQ
jgi:hypothetical protein